MDSSCNLDFDLVDGGIISLGCVDVCRSSATHVHKFLTEGFDASGCNAM